MLTAQPQSRAWREIDLEALTHNARVLQASLAPGCRLMAVVKADAYGHGAGPVAMQLRRAGVASFAVACLDEAVSLRQQGLEAELLILGYTPPEEAAALARWNLVQAVADEAHAAALAAQGIPLRVHLALDTGMHRLGIPADDHAAIARVWELPNLTVEGVFSHLCVSDSPQPEARSYTHDQVERFFAAVAWMKAHGLDPGETHLQASYGIWNLPPPALHLGQSRDRPLRRHQRRHAAPPSAGPKAGAIAAGAGGLGAYAARRGGRRIRPGLSYGPAPAAGHRHHRLCRRPQPGAAAPGRPGAASWAAVPHGGPDVHGSAAGGCHRCAGGRRRGCRHADRLGWPAYLAAEEMASVCGTITNELLSRLGPRLPIVTAPQQAGACAAAEFAV